MVNCLTTVIYRENLVSSQTKLSPDTLMAIRRMGNLFLNVNGGQPGYADFIGNEGEIIYVYIFLYNKNMCVWECVWECVCMHVCRAFCLCLYPLPRNYMIDCHTHTHKHTHNIHTHKHLYYIWYYFSACHIGDVFDKQ